MYFLRWSIKISSLKNIRILCLFLKYQTALMYNNGFCVSLGRKRVTLPASRALPCWLFQSAIQAHLGTTSEVPWWRELFRSWDQLSLPARSSCRSKHHSQSWLSISQGESCHSSQQAYTVATPQATWVWFCFHSASLNSVLGSPRFWREKGGHGEHKKYPSYLQNKVFT